MDRKNYIVRLNTKTFLGLEGSRTSFTFKRSIKKDVRNAHVFGNYSDAKRHADNVGGTVMSLEYVIKEVEDEND